MCLRWNLCTEASELLEWLVPTEPLIDLKNLDRLEISCENVISDEKSTSIFNDLQIISASENSVTNAPVVEIIQEAQDIVEVSDLKGTIKSPASFESDSSRNELAETFYTQYLMRTVIVLFKLKKQDLRIN